MSYYEDVWSFNTARYTVTLSVAEEYADYRGNCSAIDEDTDAEAEAFCAEGGWHWCQTRVQVVFRDDDNPVNWAVQRDRVLGEDYLGGCSYRDLADFKRGGYFRDMVSIAIDKARGNLRRMSAAGMRAV